MVTTPSMKKCIFCGRGGQGVRITKEHVLPNWLRTSSQGQVQGGPLELRSGGSVVDRREGVLFSVRPRIACLDCNTGWMQQLEERARPLLLPMLDGLPRPLNEAEQSIVAAWCVKTCYAVLHASRSLPKTVPAEHHKHLWESRGRNISPELDVLIGMDKTDYVLPRTSAILITSFSPRSFTVPEADGLPVYALSLRIHRFVATVVGPEIAGDREGVRQGDYPGEGTYLFRIAPSRQPAHYPPADLQEVGGFATWAGWAPNPRLDG
jgi:hypothetical protein